MGHRAKCPNGCGEEIRHTMDVETYALTPMDSYHFEHCCRGSFESGAAVLGGLLGMAHEIREQYLCRACGAWIGSRGFCRCENDE